LRWRRSRGIGNAHGRRARCGAFAASAGKSHLRFVTGRLHQKRRPASVTRPMIRIFGPRNAV
jgi:hypothetical protein